jgi:hypothetical protein
MSDKTKKIAMISGSIVLGLIVIYGVYRIVRRKVTAKTPFRRRSIKIANDELNTWNGGKRKETESAMYPTIKKYWDSIGWKESQWSPTGTAWSSAFISFIMKKAKADDEEFIFASKHSAYITKAIANRKQNNKKGFKGYRLNEKKVELGDLVCYARQNGVTYDTTGDYNSHCDLVVEIDGDNAYGIGGNVSDSVSKTKIPLVDGFAKEGNRRFVVIKTK